MVPKHAHNGLGFRVITPNPESPSNLSLRVFRTVLGPVAEAHKPHALKPNMPVKWLVLIHRLEHLHNERREMSEVAGYR